MNYKKLALGLLSIPLATSMASASVYVKFYGGNAITSNNISSDLPDNVNDGTINIRNTFTSNPFAFGGGLGFDTDVHPKIKIGIDLAFHKNTQDDEQHHVLHVDTPLLDAGQYNIEVKNRFKFIGSLSMTINKAFFFKVGPSVLRQSVTQLAIPSDNVSVKPKNADSQNIVGITLGSGFIYKLSKNFGIFTEYNYSYYGDKDISNFTAPQAAFTGGLSNGDFLARDVKYKVTQSEFFLGFMYSFFNGDGTYRRYGSCGKGPGRCRFEK